MPKSLTLETPEGPLVVVTLLYGVKETIKLICAVVEMYEKHSVNNAIDLPPDIIAALETLRAGCAVLKALNPPGPA